MLIEVSCLVVNKLDTYGTTIIREADGLCGALKDQPGATEVWKKEGVNAPLRVVWHEKRDNDMARLGWCSQTTNA